MHVGFIGLGIMGRPMALNLIKAGFNLVVYNRTACKCEEFKDKATIAQSPADVARQSEIIITIVSDTPDVESVLFDTGGVFEGLSANKIVVDMSTISPAATQNFANRLKEKNTFYVDAPVSGGDTGAIAGTLSIMAGGDTEAFARCKPLFEAMGKTVTHIGPVGHGQLTKTVNQVLVTGNLLAMVDAIRLIEKSGLDAEKVLPAVGGGAAGSWQFSNLGPRVLQHDFDPGFMIKLLVKDLKIAQNLLESLDLKMPVTEENIKLFIDALDKNYGDLGTQGIYKYFADQQSQEH